MKKSFYIIAFSSLLLIVLWQIILPQGNVYLISVAILIMSMIPFFAHFEGKKPSARELSLIATMIALAVVSRGAFYLLPQVKPIAAVVIVSAVCLGSSRGYIVGAFSAFLSNFIFGQGIWTPFQMVGLGLVGLVSGLVFNRFKANKYSLAICGFLLATVLYGVVVDTSTVLMTVTEFSFPSVFAVYGAGIMFNIAFGVATAAFLFIFGMPMIKKVDRITTKYGIIDTMNIQEVVKYE